MFKEPYLAEMLTINEFKYSFHLLLYVYGLYSQAEIAKLRFIVSDAIIRVKCFLLDYSTYLFEINNPFLSNCTIYQFFYAQYKNSVHRKTAGKDNDEFLDRLSQLITLCTIGTWLYQRFTASLLMIKYYKSLASVI